MVSMILKCFLPEPDSMVDQIKKFIKEVEAANKENIIEASGNNITSYIGACKKFMVENFDGWAPEQLQLALQELRIGEGNNIMAIYNVQVWLGKQENLNTTPWPRVLSLLCHVYTMLWLSTLEQHIYVNNSQNVYNYAKNDQKKIKEWKHLRNVMVVRMVFMYEHNKRFLNFLEGIIPIARRRGMYLKLQDRELFTTSSPTVGKVGLRSSWTSQWTYVTGMSKLTTANRSWVRYLEKKSFHPVRFDAEKGEFKRGTKFDYYAVDWKDWCLVPVPAEGEMFVVYALIKPFNPGGWGTEIPVGNTIIKSFKWNENNNQVTDGRDLYNFPDTKSTSVVAVSEPKARDDDPNKQHLPDELASILYVGVKDSERIFVGIDKGFQMPVPDTMLTYTGIAVDRYYLWVFGDNGIACTTHASVYNFIKNRRQPLWMRPEEKKDMNFVIDLSSCIDDRTILVSSREMYTAAFNVLFPTAELQGGRIVIDEWEKFVDTNQSKYIYKPNYVQKATFNGWAPIMLAHELMRTSVEAAKHNLQ